MGVGVGDGVEVAIEERESAAQPASKPALVVSNARKKWRRESNFATLADFEKDLPSRTIN